MYPFIVNPQMYNGFPSTCTGRQTDPPKQDGHASIFCDSSCKFTNIFLCDVGLPIETHCALLYYFTLSNAIRFTCQGESSVA